MCLLLLNYTFLSFKNVSLILEYIFDFKNRLNIKTKYSKYQMNELLSLILKRMKGAPCQVK